MGAATTKVPIKRRTNLRFGRLRLARQQSGRTHNHTARAVPTLWYLFFDKRGLDWMGHRRRPEALECGDRFALHAINRRRTRLGHTSVYQHIASAALPEPAAKLRRLETNLAQNKEQRLMRVQRIDRPRNSVDPNIITRHVSSSRYPSADAIHPSENDHLSPNHHKSRSKQSCFLTATFDDLLRTITIMPQASLMLTH